eukprot:366565-Chlamydomonas_euryale.AAC.9
MSLEGAEAGKVRGKGRGGETDGLFAGTVKSAVEQFAWGRVSRLGIENPVPLARMLAPGPSLPLSFCPLLEV